MSVCGKWLNANGLLGVEMLLQRWCMAKKETKMINLLNASDLDLGTSVHCFMTL